MESRFRPSGRALLLLSEKVRKNKFQEDTIGPAPVIRKTREQKYHHFTLFVFSRDKDALFYPIIVAQTSQTSKKKKLKKKPKKENQPHELPFGKKD